MGENWSDHLLIDNMSYSNWLHKIPLCNQLLIDYILSYNAYACFNQVNLHKFITLKVRQLLLLMMLERAFLQLFKVVNLATLSWTFSLIIIRNEMASDDDPFCHLSPLPKSQSIWVIERKWSPSTTKSSYSSRLH